MQEFYLQHFPAKKQIIISLILELPHRHTIIKILRSQFFNAILFLNIKQGLHLYNNFQKAIPAVALLFHTSSHARPESEFSPTLEHSTHLNSYSLLQICCTVYYSSEQVRYILWKSVSPDIKSAITWKYCIVTLCHH